VGKPGMVPTYCFTIMNKKFECQLIVLQLWIKNLNVGIFFWDPLKCPEHQNESTYRTSKYIGHTKK
jgi:hypothetical protein